MDTGLDVFETGPLPPDRPLLSLKNVIVTPHAGWVTSEARRRLLGMPVHNIAEFLAGRLVSVVNPASLKHPRRTRWLRRTSLTAPVEKVSGVARLAGTSRERPVHDGRLPLVAFVATCA